MHLYKVKNIELQKFEFLAYPQNSEKNVLLNFYDVISGKGVLSIGSWITIRRLNKRKQGNIILNDGVGVKDGDTLKEFQHIKKVEFQGSEVYKTKDVEIEERNLLEKLFDKNFFVEEKPLNVDEVSFTYENPVGKFV